MARRTNVVPKEMEVIKQRFHYNPGVKAGNLLSIAGQVGRDEKLNVVEGKEAQFVQAFENVKKVLTAAGAIFSFLSASRIATTPGSIRRGPGLASPPWRCRA